MSRLPPFSKKSTAFFLALALTACGKTPEEHFQSAQEMVRKGDYRAAVIELKTVLQEQADNAAARYLLGEVLMRNEAYPAAEKELSRAHSLGAPDDQVLPALAKVYVRLGEPQKALALERGQGNLSAGSLATFHAMQAEANLSLGKRAEAEAAIQAAMQADPKQPELLLTRAKLALIDEQRDAAAQLIDEALEGDAAFAQALYFKAALQDAEGSPDEAIKTYRQILKSDPAQFRAHLALANLYLKKGDTSAADREVQAAEKLAGKAPMVMYARGTLELQRGNPDKASSVLMEVLRIAPNHLPSMLAYAMASYSLGNYEQSISYAGKVLGAVPNHPLAAKILASSQLKTGNLNAAIRTSKAALTQTPSDARLLALAGDALLKAGNFNEAMAYLDKAEALEPTNADIKARQAAGHLAAGDDLKALADLEAAAKMSDKPGQADLALVSMRLQAKQYDEALQAIASLEKKMPNSPVTSTLRATALLGKNDRAGARKALERALSLQPHFFPAVLDLARLDLLEKKPAAARKRFEAVLAQDKNNLKAMLALADLAATEKDEKTYVSWLEKAAKADPGSIQPRLMLVRHHLGKKENQKALALARDVARANPENVQALNLLGTTQMATGDTTAAIATFEAATLKAPRSPDAYLSLAMSQLADKQFSEARGSLKRTLQLRPDFVKAQDALLTLELTERKPDAALRIAGQMQAQHPGSPVGFDREGDIQLSQKRFAEAARAYETALEKGAGTAGVVKLHRALSLGGNAKAADQQLAAWLAKNPRDVTARSYAAEYSMKTHRPRDAIAHYEEIAKLAPQNAVVLNNLANLYQQEKDSRALATAEQAYKLAPGHPGVQDTLGWILLEQGQLARASELLGQAAGQAPKTGAIRYHYGVALARLGKKAEARKELEAAIANGAAIPESDAARELLKTL